MHIPPYNNQNQPIVALGNATVPHNYFNIVTLTQGECYQYRLDGYESCIVPATGVISIDVAEQSYHSIGGRGKDVWDGEPEGVYVPTDTVAKIQCISQTTEVFIAGAKFAKTLASFVVRSHEIDVVQYGSDETKTHRKIKHILGQNQRDKVGRLLVSELYTVGAGGWSGFPSHKHDTDRLPIESHHDETYNFRFRPNYGSGIQLLQRQDDVPGDAYHIIDGSTFCIDKGYHPCVVMPGYEMYYFTILGGRSQRPLVQYFQPTHAAQVETIPGIKDMVAKFS